MDEDSSMNARIEEYVDNLEILTVEQRKKVFPNLSEVFLRNSGVFSDSPGCTHLYEHVITPTVANPYVKKSYTISIHQRNGVSREINRMLELGIIERSASKFCNLLQVVTKKSGDLRLCLDVRFINRIIVSDNECPPRIEDILQEFPGATHLSTTDLVSGYWPVLSQEIA